MNPPILLRASVTTQANFPYVQDRVPDSVNPSDDADTSSQPMQTHQQPLSDADREAAIVRAGRAIEKHMAIWHSDGCMAARGDADRARRLMELLIAGRSAAQVQRMERERGLA